MYRSCLETVRYASAGREGLRRLLLCAGEARRLARIAMPVITRAEWIAAHRARGDRLKRRLLLLAYLHHAARCLSHIDPGIQNAQQIDFGRHSLAIPHDTVARM